jgi:hypothetical protein
MKLKLSYNYVHKKAKLYKNVDLVLVIDFINVLPSQVVFKHYCGNC